jgi:holo-[acyl-carrier protein] synthase
MIIGVGVDIVQVSRLKPELAKRILTTEEMTVFEQISSTQKQLEYLAGRFCVKEAIIKAIGHTKYVIGMRDITIMNDEMGMPYVKTPVYEDIRFQISLSHEKEYSVGMCLIQNV